MLRLVDPRPVPRWLHVWAVVTAVVATAPIALGSLVTTIQAGMSDPDWPTYPWHLWLVRAREQLPFDFVVEHSHRATAWACGFSALGLAVGLWIAAPRRSLAWLGTAALLGVAAQAGLGGMRVLFDVQMGETLKMIHGLFAQIVFSLVVAVAVLTSPRRTGVALDETHSRRCLRSGLALAALSFVQVVLGVLVRHTHDGAAQRLHVLSAFAVVAAVVWFVRTAWETPANRRAFGRAAVMVCVLVGVQLCLGVEAWIGLRVGSEASQYSPVTTSSAIIRTAHVLVGAGVLAAAVVCAMQAYRATLPTASEQERSDAASAVDTAFIQRPPALGLPASRQVKGTA